MSAPKYLPFIVAPPLTCCEDAYLVFGQGDPPYTINVIATGDPNGTSLEALPLQGKPGPLRWRTDFDADANITFALTDASGQQAYSVWRAVQAGAVTRCPKNDYTSHSSPKVGAVVGGVIGGLAGLALLSAFVWWRQRVWRRHHPSSRARMADGKTPSVDDVRFANAPPGAPRAGTFNLGAVDFTEDSLTRLRAVDTPPAYMAPPRASQESIPQAHTLAVEDRGANEIAVAPAPSPRIFGEIELSPARHALRENHLEAGVPQAPRGVDPQPRLIVRRQHCAGCQARGQPCVWADGTGPSRTEEEATIDAQDRDIRRLNALVRRLSRQVVALGGTLEDDEAVRCATLSGARSSDSLEVPPLSPPSSLEWTDRRDSSASSTSAASLATPPEDVPQAWPLPYMNFDFGVNCDGNDVACPGKPAGQSMSGYTFPPPPPMSLSNPCLPTFPSTVASSSLLPYAPAAFAQPAAPSSTYLPGVDVRPLEPLCTALPHGMLEGLSCSINVSAGGIPALELSGPEHFDRPATIRSYSQPSPKTQPAR